MRISFVILLLCTAAYCTSVCTVGSQQCYVDDANRILGNEDYNDGVGYLSSELCAQECKNAGKALAGTEDGVQCFCADSVRSDAQKAPSTECNMACQGAANETCGGAWRISIFTVNCTGVTKGIPRLVNPCSDAPYASMPFCNFSLALDARVADAVSRMTLGEKILAMGTEWPAIEGLGIPPYNWWSEATHGVMTFKADATTPAATNFAFPITTAMSFNRSLWWTTGSHIAHEARAFMNAGNAWSTFWAPVINLAREPRWGRNLECPGEDPYLVGQYATSFVKGFQEAPEDPTHVLASACCKHYVANSMENTNQNGIQHDREEFNAVVPIQDLVDSYMAPFQACVELGGVTSLMCSYNAVNGVPSCANFWLLNQTARGAWGFDGYITSDCDADSDVYYRHHYTSTPEQAVQDVLRAGTDVDCGNFVPTFAQSALTKGYITESDLDARLAQLFKVRMRLGHFDPPGALQSIPTGVICSAQGRALARDGVVQAAALIKNHASTLPFTQFKGKTFAVIGPNALLSQAIAGYYGPQQVCNSSFYTVVDAIQQYATTKVIYQPGTPSVLSDDLSLIPAAVEAAEAADFTILVVGTDLTWAAEGHDAKQIVWNLGQKTLIEKVSAAAKGPVVMVLLTHTPLDLTNELINGNIGAILHCGQPSVQTLGIGDLLFGRRVPAGRLVQTFLPKSYQDSISIFDFNMRPGPSVWPMPNCTTQPQSKCPRGVNPGRTYRFYTGMPVLPFGFGLSYTTFNYSYSPLQEHSIRVPDMHFDNSFPSLRTIGKNLVSYQVTVTNTGSVDADDVVLGMLIPPGAGTNGIPLKQLFGFERVHVPAGKSVTVFLYPQLKDVLHTNTSGKRELLRGEYTVEFGIAETRPHGQGYARTKLIVR